MIYKFFAPVLSGQFTVAATDRPSDILNLFSVEPPCPRFDIVKPRSPKTSSTKSWLVHALVAGAAVAVAFGAHRYFLRSGKFQSRVIGIIPARFASTRFPGKPLVDILGKPTIQRTWERAKLARALDQVVVATDDEKIAECCRGFGAEVIMTSESCRNGTERCNEALQKLEKKYDIVVNIQGDYRTRNNRRYCGSPSASDVKRPISRSIDPLRLLYASSSTFSSVKFPTDRGRCLSTSTVGMPGAEVPAGLSYVPGSISV
nr:3-deoxy-manno-octulosonate cytidylyltransferase, mitochondrial [Ipomoea batatas]